MQQILAEPKKPRQEYGYDTTSRGELALTLAGIGRLLGNTNWLEQGIRVAREEVSQTRGQNPGMADYYALTLRKNLANFLLHAGRGPEAEALLSDALTATTASTGQEQSYSWGDPASRVCLAGLVS